MKIYAQDIYRAGEKVNTEYCLSQEGTAPFVSTNDSIEELIGLCRRSSFGIDYGSFDIKSGDVTLKVILHGGDAAKVVIERALTPSELEAIARRLSSAVKK